MIETEVSVETVTNRSGSVSEPSAPKGNERSSNGTMSLGYLVAHLLSFGITAVIIKSFWQFENASGALAFYGVYHRYGWNQVVHFFGVPGIIWSLLIFMVHVPIPIVGDHHSLNYANCLAICYNLYYLSIDPFGAVLYAPVIHAMYASAEHLRQKDQAKAAGESKVSGNTSINNNNNTTNPSVPWYGTGKALRFGLLVHVFCWYIQIHLGHEIIEGAKPAVLQGLGGALSVAPLFAYYEGLWYLGINKELQESTQLLIDEYTQELCAERGIDFMRVCRTLITQE